MQDTLVLVGLGNPGWRYKRTRHNVGFMVIDELRRRSTVLSRRKTSRYEYYEIDLNSNKRVVLVKPKTFMNRSGEAVVDVVAEFAIPLNHLLIISDDFNLPFGSLRFRPKGSAGGHNGLKSVIASLNDQIFPRLRLGIGGEDGEDVVKFVLSKFARHERAALTAFIARAADACAFFVKNGITKSMNQYN